ncbi:Far1 [Hordeum vulgare]|nr:Far1 [Hordeum vulgare]
MGEDPSIVIDVVCTSNDTCYVEFGELLKHWIDDWSDDENSDRADWSKNGNEGGDVNMDVDNDSDENNSKVWNEYYISQLISRYHNAYDYYGESDTETGLENKSVDAPDFRESRSSVNMSEVCMKSVLYERNVQP